MDITDVDIDPGSLTVVQVYELAAHIGKQFESIIDVYGQDAVTGLMPKVVKLLELMEGLAEHNEHDNGQVNELRLEVAKLKSAALFRDEESLRREKVQILEENYKDDENNELIKVIKRLEHENDQLRNALVDRDKIVQEGSVALKQQEAINNEELVLLHTLKDTVVKQRDQLRSQEKQMDQLNIDCDALQLQLDRLASVNEELRCKMLMVQAHTKAIIEKNVASQTKLDSLKNKYNLNDTLQQLDIVESDQENVSPNNTQVCERNSGIKDITNDNTGEQTGKMLIDLTDPNRPRYTRLELQKVLMERDSLLVKVCELEEELTVYKDDFVVPPVPADSARKPRESGIKRIFGYFSRSKSPTSPTTTTTTTTTMAGDSSAIQSHTESCTT